MTAPLARVPWGRATAAAAGLALLFPQAARACPSCAAQAGNAALTLLLIGGMILFPFAVTAIVVQVIRRSDRGPEAT